MQSKIELVFLEPNNDYINKLSQFLTSRGESTTPELHKQVILNRGMPNEFKTKFSRPYVAFEYSPVSKFIKCFPLGTFKRGKDKLTDPRFFFIIDRSNKIKGKVILVKPTYIPTKYLKVINFKKEIRLAHKFNNIELSRWLSNLNIERSICRQQSKIILACSRLIRNGKTINGINYSQIKKKYYINESLVYYFCNAELVNCNTITKKDKFSITNDGPHKL